MVLLLSQSIMSWIQTWIFAPSTAHYKLLYRLNGLSSSVNAVEIGRRGALLASAGDLAGSVLCFSHCLTSIKAQRVCNCGA